MGGGGGGIQQYMSEPRDRYTVSLRRITPGSHTCQLYTLWIRPSTHTLEKHISRCAGVYGEICLTAVLSHNAMIYHDNTVVIHIWYFFLKFVHTWHSVSLYYSRNVDIIKYTSPIKVSQFADTFHPNRKETGNDHAKRLAFFFYIYMIFFFNTKMADWGF